MAASNPPYLWLDGAYVAWGEATMHITEAAAAGMTTVFEGIRGYTNPETGAVNIPLLGPHWERFAHSLKVMGLDNPYTAEDFTDAVLGLLERNDVRVDSYIRPIGYMAGGAGFLHSGETHIAISTRPYGSHLLSGMHQAVCVSSWTRISDTAMPPRLKAQPNYHNSRLAMNEARRNGYDGAIMLNSRGTVAEGPGACVFVIRKGVAVTPPVTAGILESITRGFMIEMLPLALGIPVVEREIDRTELYVADEIFFCGTGAEVTPVSSVDRFTIGGGGIGPLTTRVERFYHDVIRGLLPDYAQYLTTFYPAAVGSPAD
jgi:branched-chain amino acid aminotransferase